MIRYFFIGLCFWSSLLHAEATVTQQITIPQTVSLAASPLFYQFGNVSPKQFDLGYSEALNATTIVVKSNTTWQLTVRSTQSDMGVQNGSTKPLSHFLWRLAGQTYSPITLQDTRITTGSASAGKTVNMDYRVLTRWTDQPGTYTLSLTFTLSSAV